MSKEKRAALFPLVSFLLFLFVTAAWAEPAPKKILDLANTEIAAFGTDPILVAAARAENARHKTLAQIKGIDAKWMATPGVDDFMKSLMDSEAGKHLIDIRTRHPFIAEIFVMDDQGANVAMSDKTSDYWQGDEAKWQKSFNKGQGTIFVDEVEFDSSSQAYLVQVSVPVKDDGQTIGAITFGIDIDKVE